MDKNEKAQLIKRAKQYYIDWTENDSERSIEQMIADFTELELEAQTRQEMEVKIYTIKCQSKTIKVIPVPKTGMYYVSDRNYLCCDTVLIAPICWLGEARCRTVGKLSDLTHERAMVYIDDCPYYAKMWRNYEIDGKYSVIQSKGTPLGSFFSLLRSAGVEGKQVNPVPTIAIDNSSKDYCSNAHLVNMEWEKYNALPDELVIVEVVPDGN